MPEAAASGCDHCAPPSTPELPACPTTQRAKAIAGGRGRGPLARELRFDLGERPRDFARRNRDAELPRDLRRRENAAHALPAGAVALDDDARAGALPA